ncbi:hypothetical protein FD16_GL001616 [Paucilactobacillus suebicus DSM 5007 = KCTC 3549]|uniref:Uncharacterized protein n=1 Tax=Paucilactobacillus suebicus DSM 5007 = KCTC 3549 TaxID=1423807 RepID=A0A0R1W0B7_9LACO|nr:hypothetical protein FD16_GL001616 [Paucilactobacillus suebicus DSM 5007 = KCTC 3549]
MFAIGSSLTAPLSLEVATALAEVEVLDGVLSKAELPNPEFTADVFKIVSVFALVPAVTAEFDAEVVDVAEVASVLSELPALDALVLELSETADPLLFKLLLLADFAALLSVVVSANPVPAENATPIPNVIIEIAEYTQNLPTLYIL